MSTLESDGGEDVPVLVTPPIRPPCVSVVVEQIWRVETPK